MMKFDAVLSINRFEWAKKSISELANVDKSRVNLYDIGARDSVFKSYCNELNVTYYGFDLEPIDQQVRTWNLEDPFPYTDVKADIVTLLEVIEHLNNPWLCIKNLSHTLVKDGFLILTTPNPAWSNSRLNLLFKGKLACFMQSDLDNNHHVFTPWPHIIEKLLTDNGFKIIKYVTLDGPTQLFQKPYRGIKFPLQLLKRSLTKIVEKFDSTSCGMGYGIIAQKIK